MLNYMKKGLTTNGMQRPVNYDLYHCSAIHVLDNDKLYQIRESCFAILHHAGIRSDSHKHVYSSKWPVLVSLTDFGFCLASHIKTCGKNLGRTAMNGNTGKPYCSVRLFNSGEFWFMPQNCLDDDRTPSYCRICILNDKLARTGMSLTWISYLPWWRCIATTKAAQRKQAIHEGHSDI